MVNCRSNEAVAKKKGEFHPNFGFRTIKMEEHESSVKTQMDHIKHEKML